MAEEQVKRVDVTSIVKGNVAQIEQLLTQSQDRVAQVIQGHIRADRMIAVALELVTGDSKLCLCEPLTILKAVMEASQLGLLLNKHLGHGYLVPYKNGALTRKHGVDMYDANFLVGYKGFVHLAKQCDKTIHKIFSRIVYTEEYFEIFEGTRHEISHVPSTTFRSIKDYIGAYAIVMFNNGAQADFEWMPRGEIEKVKKHAKAKGGAVWDSWEEEQIKKTTIRRLCKRLELSPEILEATVRDEYRELGYEGEKPQARTIQMPRRASEAVPVAPEDENQERPAGEPEPPQGEPPQQEQEPTVHLVSVEDRQAIFDEAKKSGFTSKEEVLSFLLKEFGFKETKDVTAAEYPRVLQGIRARLTGDMSWKNPGANAPESSGKPEAEKAGKPAATKGGKKGKKDDKPAEAPAEPTEGATKQVVGALEKAELCISQKDQSKYLELTVANAPGVLVARNPAWLESLPKQIGKRLAIDIKLIDGVWEVADWFIAAPA